MQLDVIMITVAVIHALCIYRCHLHSYHRRQATAGFYHKGETVHFVVQKFLKKKSFFPQDWLCAKSTFLSLMWPIRFELLTWPQLWIELVVGCPFAPKVFWFSPFHKNQHVQIRMASGYRGPTWKPLVTNAAFLAKCPVNASS